MFLFVFKVKLEESIDTGMEMIVWPSIKSLKKISSCED